MIADGQGFQLYIVMVNAAESESLLCEKGPLCVFLSHDTSVAIIIFIFSPSLPPTTASLNEL